MKTIIIIVMVMLFVMSLTAVAFSIEEQRGSRQTGINFVSEPVQQPPGMSTAPQPPPQNPVPILDSLYCPLVVHFDNYFEPIPDLQSPTGYRANLWAFLDLNRSILIGTRQVLDIETQVWISTSIPTYEWEWDLIPNHANYIFGIYGMYDHFSSYLQQCPNPQQNGFRWNELYLGERKVFIRLTASLGYFFNEEQFKQFLLQGYTTILIQMDDEEEMY